jgi:hypothetical protein
VLFFKSVILFNRFKKCKFLAPKRRIQEKIFAKGNLEEIFCRGYGKAKLAYFIGDKHIFTQNKNIR